MKRKDAFRKIRTICQRLDDVDPQTFHVQPLRLYLYGSLLTDKPDPTDVDLILVYDNSPNFDPRKEVAAISYGRPTAAERAIIHLRRRMKMIRIMPAKRSLADWLNQEFLLNIRPRLIWEPGADWGPAVDEIEASPLPWPGPRPPDADERHKTFILGMSSEEYDARLRQALAEIEAQDLP
jgi:hypothetical protein